MDVARIQELSDLFEAKGLTKMEISDGETKVLLEKEPAPIVASVSAPAEVNPAAAASSAAPTPAQPTDSGARLTEVKSPMVGVFYASPNPEEEPFVQVGTAVKRGDVLCIVEAMKLMNEITAETDGEIAEICVENGQVVEFSQTLFKIY